MDVKRDPAILRKKKIRRTVFLALAGVAVVVISVAVSRLKPAAPSVSASTLWYGTVVRGPLTVEVHGAGTLVPVEIRWIPATTSGRVEKLVLQPGAIVKPGTVILELSNPDLEQQARNARLAWESSQAQLANAQATMHKDHMSQQASVKDAKSRYDLAVATLQANKQLADEGLVSQLKIQEYQASVDQAKTQLDLAQQQLDLTTENEQSQLAPAQADVNQKKAQLDLVMQQLDDLKVKSPISGVLQVMGANVEVGAQVGQGTNLARVADPTNLKAEVRISETTTKDLRLGLPAKIDTRNGIVPGKVIRIDPAAQGGTVGVDVSLDGPLPPGARPDLNVDGTIELDRLENVLKVERPAYGQENNTVGLFKLISPDGQPILAGQEPGHEAVQTQVKLGRASVQYIQILDGLKEGDRVVLSDMSQYDAYDRVRLN
jgi:HlyD family secretion protein